MITIAAVLTAVACHDDEVVGPRARTPHPFTDSRNKPIGEYDLQIPSDNSWPSYGALALTSTSISLPENQWVVLTITGGVELQISSLCSNYPDCPATATHSGQTIDALGLWPSWLQVRVSGAGYANIPFYYDDQSVPTALVWSGSGGVLSASRNGIQDGVGCYSPWPDPNTGITGCPPPNGTETWFFAYAYTMTGEQSLEAAVVDPLVVHGTPTSIHPGDSVTFTATLVQSMYKNGNTWTWVAGEVGNQQQDEITNDPPSGGVNVGCNASPCVYAPTQSGRMYVQSTDYYGHPMRGSSEYIAINSGKLRLTASPNVIGADTGILASRVHHSVTSLGQPPIGASFSARRDETGTGTTVEFLASTSDHSSFTIQAWSFQPDSAALGTSTPCSPSANPCVTAIAQPGTMFVTALIGGNQELASAHVQLLCPTVGDSILDAPGIVDALKLALEASNPNAEPGTGVKHEQLGGIFRRQDGTYFTVPANDPSATECHTNPMLVSQAPPPGEDSATFVALYHTHPSKTWEPVYGCYSDSLFDYAQYKGEPNKKIPLADPDHNGGGSPGDWGTTNQGFHQYIINKNGHIWHLVPNSLPDTNHLEYSWKKSSSCAKHA